MFSICSNNCIKLWRNKWNSERPSNIKPFINKYNWEGINYPLNIDDWKTFEKNNLPVALNIVYVEQKEVYPAYMSKGSSNSEKKKKKSYYWFQTKKKKKGFHYLTIKKSSKLLRGIASKHHDDFCCLNSLYSFITKIPLNFMKEYVKIKIFVEL